MSVDNLTECQKKAFEVFKQQIHAQEQDKKNIVISGPGGVGKTYLTKTIFSYLVENGIDGVYLAAPTHQAKNELIKSSGMEASTIHSLLKISPSTYEEVEVFEQQEAPDLSKCRVLILDEVSMYDAQLFSLVMSSVPRFTLIIGLGDSKQLRPVSLDGKIEGISKFFTSPEFIQVELVTNKRNKGNLLKVCTDLREGKPIYELYDSKEGAKQVNVKEFFGHYFEKVKTKEDMLNNRILAFTNDSVDKINDFVHKRIFKTDEPFVVGEYLVIQEPLSKDVRIGRKTLKEIIYNNGTILKVLGITKHQQQFTAPEVPHIANVEYYSLKVENLVNGKEPVLQNYINVFATKEETLKFWNFLSKIAVQYKSNSSLRRYWKHYWEHKRFFVEVKSLAASTIYKAQGSTFDNVFYYRGCAPTFDNDLFLQSEYVATSRARNMVYFT